MAILGSMVRLDLATSSLITIYIAYTFSSVSNSLSLPESLGDSNIKGNSEEFKNFYIQIRTKDQRRKELAYNQHQPKILTVKPRKYLSVF